MVAPHPLRRTTRTATSSPRTGPPGRSTADGEPWRTALDAPPAAVTVADGTAYLGCATEQLLAVDTATGEVRWRGSLRNTAFTPPLVTDDGVYVGAADYHLYGFGTGTGEARWAAETGNAVTAGPTVAEDRLVTLSGGQHDPRGPAGTVPREPVELAVHDTDGTRVDGYRFDAVVGGGQPRWAGAVDGGVYLAQEQTVTRLDGVVLGDG